MITGKNILITGATAGIGKAMTDYFYSKGANLIVAARSKEKLNNILYKLNKNILTCPLDLSKPENIKELFEFIKSHSIKLDGIVHCAGATANIPIRANDVSQTEYLFRLNFEAFSEICKYASSKQYSNDGASVIAISSTASLCGNKGLSIYSATKAAINNFVKSAALELSSRKIRVNAIAPAFVDTDMYYKTIEECPNVEQEIKYSQPFGLIQPEYIAYIAEFLISEKAKYISGSTIVLGAGSVF